MPISKKSKTPGRRSKALVEQVQMMEGDVVFICPPSETSFMHGSCCSYRVGFQKKIFDEGDVPLNFYDCLWQVLPQLPFQQRKMMRKFIKRGKTDDEHFQELQKRVAAENASNQEIISQIIDSGGGPVYYGRTIQLRHVRTKKFLTAKKKASNSDREAMQLGLEDDILSATIFFISARIKIRTEGDPVFYNDLVNLGSAKIKGYSLNATSTYFSEFDLEPRITEANLIQHCPPVKICYFSRVQETGALTNLHIGYPMRFYHHESVSFIQASANKAKANSSATQRYSPYLKRVEDGDYQNIGSFSSKAAWSVEKVLRDKGGLIQWDVKIRLRHIPSGLYLAISYVPEPNTSSKKKEMFAPMLVCEKDLPALMMDECQLVFVFKETRNDVDQKVTFADDVLLQHTKHEGAEERQLYLKWTREAKGGDNKKGSTMMFSEKVSDADAFQLVEIEAPRIPILLNMITFRDIGDQYIMKLGASSEPLEDKDLIEEYGMLTELMRSIVEVAQPNTPIEDIEGPSDEFQQTMARHLKLMNTVFSMIQAPLEKGIRLEHTVPLDKRFRPVHNIHILLFRVLTQLFLGNADCELYFCKQKITINASPAPVSFLQVLMQQVIYPWGAGDCLTNLLSENQQLLDEYVNDELLGKFNQLIATQGINEEFLEFFAAICCSKNKPVVSNQELLLKAVVYNESANKKFLIQHHVKPFKLKKVQTPSIEFPDRWDQLQAAFKQLYVYWHGTDDFTEDDREHIYYSPKSKALAIPYESTNFISRQYMFSASKITNTKTELLVRIEDFAWAYEKERLSKPTVTEKDSLQIVECAAEDCEDKQADLVEYFIAQIEMFSEMSLGRCQNVIREFRCQFPFAMLMSLILNKQLPYHLQGAYTALFYRLWVDSFPHELNCGYDQLPNLVWIYAELKDKSVKDVDALPQFRLPPSHPLYNNPDEFLSYKFPNKFDLFKKFFIQFCKAEMSKGQALDEREKNIFFLNQLKVVNYLLSSGFYAKYEELSDLCDVIIKALLTREGAAEHKNEEKLEEAEYKYTEQEDMGEDGEDELEDSDEESDEETDYTQILMDSKTVICKSLIKVAELSSHYRLEKCLYGFRKFQETDQSNRKPRFSNLGPLARNYQKLQDEKAFLLFKSEEQLEKIFMDTFVSEDAKLLHFSKNTDVPLDLVLVCLMMDPSDDLFNQAFGLFYSNHSQREFLLSKLESVRLLSTSVVPLYGTYQQLSLDIKLLANLFETHRSWGASDEFADQDPEGFKRVYQILNAMTKFLLIPEPESSQDIIECDRDPSVDFKAILKKKVNKGHQDLLFLAGTHKVLLKSVDMLSRNDGSGKHPMFSLKGVFRTVMGCLCLLVKLNCPIQAAVFPALMGMTELMASDSSLGIATVFLETLRENQELCETLERDIFELFARMLASTKNKELFDFFRLTIHPGGVLISKNQLNVISVLHSAFDLSEMMRMLCDYESANPNGKIPDTPRESESAAKLTKPKRKTLGQRLASTLKKKKKQQEDEVLSDDASVTSLPSTPRAVTKHKSTNKMDVPFSEKLKSSDIVASLKFWTQLIRVLADCAKGRENLSVMGTLQKSLPSDFLIDAIGHIISPDSLTDVFNRDDLLLSLTLFLDQVYLDTQLPEERLVEDKELQIVLMKLSKYVRTLDLTGQVALDSIETSTASELDIHLGISIISCFKNYFKRLRAGTEIEGGSRYFKNIVFSSRKIAHKKSFSRIARMLAFETLECLGVKYDVDMFTALQEYQREAEKKTTAAPVIDLQWKFMTFVQTLQTSPRIKDLLKDEKMEMVDIVQHIERITNPSSEASPSEKLPKIITDYSKKSAASNRSQVITLKDMLRRIQAYLLQSMLDESMQPTCASVFGLLTWMLERDFEKLEDAESLDQGSVEHLEKVVGDARKSHQSRQALFADMGLADVVFEAILRSPGGGMEYCAFKLGEAMLMKGNRTVQERLDRYARTHDPLGRFFRNIRDKISAASKEVLRARTVQKLYPDLYKPPTSSLEESTSMFGFLQQLCEGSFRSMQQMLYAQPFNRKSYNLVQEAVEFAIVIAKDRDNIRALEDIYILALSSSLDLLIEVTQGPCPENQLCISGSQVVEICGYITSTSEFEGLTKPELGYDLRVKGFTLLCACLEVRPDLVVEKRLASKLDTSFYNSEVIQLHNRIQQLEASTDKPKRVTRTAPGKELDEDRMGPVELKEFAVKSLVQSAASLFYLRDKISLLDEFKKICAPPKQSDKSQIELYVAYEGLKNRLGYIEVNWMNQIEIFYFPMPDEAESLTLTTMLGFEGTVTLESQDARVKALMEASVSFMDEMKVLDSLKSNWLYMAIKENLLSIQYTNFFLSVCLNFMSLMGVTGSKIDSMRTPAAFYVLQFLNLSTFLGYLTLVCFFMASFSQLKWRELSRNYREAVLNKLEPDAFTSKDPLKLWSITFFGYIALCAIMAVAFAEVKGTLTHGAIFGAMVFPLALLRAARAYYVIPTLSSNRVFCWAYDVLFDGKILGNVLLCACCGLGFINVFFYTLLLCNIVTLSEDAYNVILAVTTPGRALGVTGVLFVIVILIFSTLGFILYGQDSFCEGGDCELTPRNLYDTFWLVLDGGIRSGDIGSLMTATSHLDTEVYHQRILFMLSFFIILGALLFNMVTGIIVDTFSSLREETAVRLEKINSESFISGISREEYDEVGLKFEDLTQEHQNIWSYVYFLLQLDQKDASEMCGAERFVVARIKDNDTSWFPIFMSFELQKTTKATEEGDSLEDQISEAIEKITIATDKIDKTEDDISVISKQVATITRMLAEPREP